MVFYVGTLIPFSANGAADAASFWLSAGGHRYVISVAIFAASIILRRGIARLLIACVAFLAEALSKPLSDNIRRVIKPPVEIASVAIFTLFALSILDLPNFLGDVLSDIAASILIAAIFGMWFQLSESVVSMISPQHLSRIKLETNWATNLFRLLVLISGFSAIMSQWDIQIGSAVTGVGVLGAGIAIASQDLLKNLLAGMSNVGEERYKVGDWIEVVGVVEGIVYRIDLRSTMIMGFDRIPHYVPNAILANSVVRNKARRDHRRVYWKVQLLLESTEEQINSVISDLHRHLEDSGDFVVNDSILRLVNLDGFSDSSVDVTIYAFTNTNEFAPYLEACDRLTRAIRDALDKAGTDLAYPTQTLYVEKGQLPAANK